MSDELGFHDEHDLLREADLIQNIYHIDQLWTRWLGRSELDSFSKDALADVARTLEQYLEVLVLKDRVSALESTLAARSNAAAENMSLILNEVPDAVRTYASLATPEGYREFAFAALTRLQDVVPGQVDRLATKATELRKGDWVPGDLDHHVLCALLSVLLSSALALSVKRDDSWAKTAIDSLKELMRLSCLL